MPLPQESLTIRGGCNCHAIRYKIDIPPASQRPFAPALGNSVRLPYIIFCHCDDCRRATASLVLSGLYVPKEMVLVSLSSRSSPNPSLTKKSADQLKDDAQREWIPASQVFVPSNAPSDSYLTTYKSSETVYRTFCGRCGTPLTAAKYPLPEHWPEMLDFLLGSVDREYLEKDYMMPDKHVFWQGGIPWFKKLFCGENPSVLKNHDPSSSETTE